MIRGEDGELRTALDHFHKMVEEGEGAVSKAILACIVKIDTTTVRTEANTKALMASVGRMDDQSEREYIFIGAFVVISEIIQGQRAKTHCDELLDWISSLNFAKKQEDVFNKWHPGTGEWFLRTTEFQAWFTGDQNSMLWCAGIRKFEMFLILASCQFADSEQAGAGKTVLT